MARRAIPEINAGSMADIAFLLLIFFLVTTTMDTDGGLTRKLPPPLDEDVIPPKVNERNIIQILVNANDQLLVRGEIMRVTDLRKKVKEYIASDPLRSDYPKLEPKNIPFFSSSYPVSKQIVSLQNDRGTSYEMYIKVQNELVAAYNELRNELALRQFQKPFDQLEKDKAEAIKDIYPQRISEAEPKQIGDN